MEQHFPFLFPLLFIGAWGFVLYILSFASGWQRLAQQYRAQGKPSGKKLRGQSAMIRKVSYNHVLTIIISERGFYIAAWGPFRLAHAPLLIPWRDIRNVTFKKFLWIEMARFEVNVPPTAAFQVKRKVIEAARPFLEIGAMRD